MTEILLEPDEVLLTVERYQGRPDYRVVTHRRTFDAPSLAVVQHLVLQVATRDTNHGPGDLDTRRGDSSMNASPQVQGPESVG